MAKVFGPALSIDAKGKIGKGLCFQDRPKGNAFMKNPRSGVGKLENPTPSQKVQRDIIAALISKWQSLNANQRGYWDNVAKELKNNLSGYHEFMRAKSVPTMPYSRLLDYYPDLKRGLKGYWAMEGDGADAAKDLSGNANHGILKPTYPANCPEQVGSKNMILDKALKFDGIQDYINCGNDPSLNITDAITIEAWVYSSVGQSFKSLVQKGALGDYDYMLYWSGGASPSVNFGIKDSSGTSSWGTAVSVSLNSWIHVVGVYDGDKLYIYINGELGSSKETALTNIRATSNNLNIGRWSSSYYFNGTIDEVRIYNRALSVPELRVGYDIGVLTHI